MTRLGVYVGDASALPTATGVNPMISTMAIAHRTAEAIAADSAGRAPRPSMDDRRRRMTTRHRDQRPRSAVCRRRVESSPPAPRRSPSSTPATEEEIARIPAGDAPEDVDRAVTAARAAVRRLGGETTASERGVLLAAVAERSASVATSSLSRSATELGMPHAARAADPGRDCPTMTFASDAGLLDELPGEEEIGNSLVVREPYRRCRRHRALELPAAPDRRQGQRRALAAGLHRRAQAKSR